jgi:hypothetical protein
MQDSSEDARVDALVMKFVEGTKLYFEGLSIFDNKRQSKGVKKLRGAAMALDEIGTGRHDALARLLDSDDPELCVMAAGYLMKVMPERALALAQKVEDMTLGHISFVATTLLFAHKWGDEMP